MTNEELLAMLEKAGITTATGGLMPPEATNAFIDTTVDQSSFLQEIRVERNIATTRYLDSLGAGKRMMRKAVEGVDDSAGKVQGVTAARRSLVPVSTELDYDISFEWLKQNIEREAAEQKVNQMFAKQFSNDLTDLAFNGDIADAGADAAFLNITDGFLKRLGADAASHVYARGAGVDWKGTVFPALLEALPEKYQGDPTQLRLYTSFKLEREYRASLSIRETALGDQYLTERRRAQFQGIEVHPVYGIPYGAVILTSPQNLATGLGSDIEVYRQVVPRRKTIEYTILLRVDDNYAVSDGLAYCI